MSNFATLESAYKLLQRESNIHVNDTVKVLRKAESQEYGWNDVWTPEMDRYIGESLRVDEIFHDRGFHLAGTNSCFPFFVLELILPEIPKTEVFDIGGTTVELIWNDTKEVAIHINRADVFFLVEIDLIRMKAQEFAEKHKKNKR